MKKILIAAAVASTMFAGSANAGVITQTDIYGYATTNWTHTLGSLVKFDSALGTLNSIVVSLYGAISQNLSAENLGGSADDLTPIAGGTIKFRQAASTVLAQVLPTTTGTTFAATAYDGIDDKAGTSGINFGTLTANDSSLVTLSGAQLAAFIGSGSLAGFDIRAVGNGAIDSANGNLSSVIQTSAYASLTLTYNYTDAVVPTTTVPEPASMALLGLGLAGLAAIRRRK